MPSLDVTEYIDECILSALNQTLIEKEIICIDAGSTDGTWEKLNEYANDPKYGDQIILLQSDVKSYGYQVNMGIRNASGEYVAILETDDYIENEMYEYLYKIAIKNDADFVKADYDTFFTNTEHKKFFDRVMLFENSKEKYEKVLNPSKDLYLYTNDHSIWKGIYKRDFLLNHNIFLNESRGAAFQDIGFVQQVIACADRGIYSSRSFYRYRTDREQSSVNSVYGLQFSYEEFRRLLDRKELKEKFTYIDGLYAYMVKSFCVELKKTLRAVEYDVNSEFIKPYYKWFKRKILDAIKEKIVDLDLCQIYSQLADILDDICKYSIELKLNDFIQEKNMKKLISIAEKRQIIVFGVGGYGKLVINYLYSHDLNIEALSDNNKSLWNTSKYDLVIYQPTECVVKFPEHMYIIANKKNNQDIYEQLINLGIKEKNIYICV